MKTLIFLSVFYLQLMFGQINTLIVVTEPESCRIFLNNRFRGISPLLLPESLLTDINVIHIQKQGFVPQVKQFEKKSVPEDAMLIRLTAAAQLTISSKPEGAAVFIDSMLYGLTPLTIDTLLPRTISLILSKRQFLHYKIAVTVIEKQNIILSPTLQPISAYINISSNMDYSELFIDGKKIGNGSVDSVNLGMGGHRLTVYDPQTGATSEERFILNTSETKKFHATMRYFSFFKITYGIAVPGLSQLVDGSFVKSVLLLGSAAYSVSYYQKSKTNYEDAFSKFTTAQDQYLTAPTESSAEIRRNALLQRNDELKKATTTINVAMFLPFIVWAINTIDVVYSHSLSDKIIDITENQAIQLKTSSDRAALQMNYKITF